MTTVSPLNSYIEGSPNLWRQGSISSSTANLDITNLPNDAASIDFIFTNLIPTDDARILIARVSSNNGTSFDSGASDYSSCGRYLASSSGYNGNTGASSMSVIHNALGINANEVYNCRFRLIRPGTASVFTKMLCNGVGTNSSTAAVGGFGGVIRETASAVNAVRFLFNVGNIASLDYKIYLNQ